MELTEFFHQYPRIALAFSGGTDSAYLLWAAREAGAQVGAYLMATLFQPAFELADARRLAEELGAPLRVISYNVLEVPEVAANPPDRCYHCKGAMFRQLLAAAAADGYHAVMDGTNASDDAGDRPGMRALRELGVLSPLRLCGITKEEVRRRSREAGLFTWDKPSYACLATRVPTGTAITAADLRRVEAGEEALRTLGFSDLRLRLLPGGARLELPGGQLEEAARRAGEIRAALAPWFDMVLLDLKGREANG